MIHISVSPTFLSEYTENKSFPDFLNSYRNRSVSPCSPSHRKILYLSCSHFTEPLSYLPLFFMTTRRIDDLLLSSAPTPTPATVYTDPHTTHHGHFLPGNPMPYMAPSATHQPELLLLTWMITTITSIVEDLQHHPIVHDPIPAMSSFTNTSAHRLYLQIRNALRHLINTTHNIQRGLNILQFLPGSPGSPGHYRMDPTIHFTPGHSNYLSSSFQSTITTSPPPADTQSPPLTPLL